MFTFPFVVERLYLRSDSEPNSLNLRSKIASSPTLHRLCTDFGTEEERRINGRRTAIQA